MTSRARILSGICLATIMVSPLALQTSALVNRVPAEARCRRVKLDGAIRITPKPKPAFKGVVNTSEGTFTMDLIFPERGGEILHQQNSVSLTRLVSHSYGGARQCRNTLPADALVARPFNVWAKLQVDGVVVEDANQKVKAVLDQFDMMVKKLPTFPAISYTVSCDGGQPGAASDHATAVVQLLQVFARTQYSGSLKLNRIGDRRQMPVVDIFGTMVGSAEWEALETLVPCASFIPGR